MMRDNRKEKNIKRKRRKKKRYLLKFVILILICTGLYFAVHIDYFKIDSISVAGNKEILDEEIVKLSKIEKGENLFDVHPFFAQRRIKKNLYIGEVDVDRKLPNKVVITIKERSGKAQFLMGKKYVVTDNEGMVLDISKEEKHVTLVENVKVEEAKLKKNIEVKETEIYDKAMELIKSAEKYDLYFKKVNINGKVINGYIYDGLICKGTYKNIMDSMESGALKTVVFDLYQKGIEKGIINVGSNNYCSFTP